MHNLAKTFFVPLAVVFATIFLIVWIQQRGVTDVAADIIRLEGLHVEPLPIIKKPVPKFSEYFSRFVGRISIGALQLSKSKTDI